MLEVTSSSIQWLQVTFLSGLDMLALTGCTASKLMHDYHCH
jgi:hypothetical protein